MRVYFHEIKYNILKYAYPKDPPIVPYQKSESFNAILRI